MPVSGMGNGNSIQGGAWSRVGMRPGTILAGKYRVDRVLGAGGMGVVVAAHHLQLDERVAIKFLLPEALEIPEAVTRFEHEARAAVKIKSEHVARIIDIGTLDGGAPYMVMEYLEGEDLAKLVLRGALPVEQAVEFTLQACEALAEAHVLGIVHRDLKPANLFCIRRPDGLLSVKVLDFGISKMTGLAASPGMSITKTGAVMGSPLYMSPEQMQSARAVDARTDIWALGVILFELLTARVPFGGESLPEVCVSIATRPPPSIRALRPEVPAALEASILKCLTKQREDRYANLSELALALAPFGPKRARTSVDRISRVIRGSGAATSSAIPPSSDGGAPATPITIAGWGQAGLHRTIGGRTRLLGVAAIGVLGSAAFAVLWVRKGPLTAEAPTSSVTRAPPMGAVATAAGAHPGTSQEPLTPSLPSSVYLPPVASSVATRVAPVPQPLPATPRRGISAAEPTRSSGVSSPMVRMQPPAPMRSGEVVLQPAPSPIQQPSSKPNELGGRL